MIGRTLGIYFTKLFLKNVFLIFLLILVLIVAVDMTDQARRMSRYPDAPMSDFLLISLAKAPGFAERILPFATLFGCIATLVVLNKKMELVVARAAGVSVWQFLWPALMTAIALGMFSMMVYNPFSIQVKELGKSVEARVYGKKNNNEGDRSSNLWLRQYGAKGDMIIHAAVSRNHGRTLNGITAHRFDREGRHIERIDAASAEYHKSRKNAAAQWSFKDVSVSVSGESPFQMKEYRIDSNLTLAQLSNASTSAADVSFWQLPKRIRTAESSGNISNSFQMQFHSLLARPLLFVAMVLIAATVSLKFVRFGQNSKVILTGILAGFVLYVISELVVGFGKNGIVPPWVAAWSPATVATLIGLTIILHQEDG